MATVGQLSSVAGACIMLISLRRSERFYYTYSAFLVTELVALPLASVLMQKSIMLPFVIALLSLGCCFPVLGMIKGRRAQGQLRTSGDEATAGLLETTTGEDNGVATTAGSKKPWTLRVLLQDLWKVVADIDASTALVLLGHFICPVRQELVFQILIPYTSKRFELPIANVRPSPLRTFVLVTLTTHRLVFFSRSLHLLTLLSLYPCCHI